MASTIFFQGRYQLGDSINPIVFPDSIFVGLVLSLPFRYRPEGGSTSPTSVTFVFETSKLETWAEWQAHRVLLNSTEIGKLRDTGDGSGPTEVHRFALTPETIEAIDWSGPLTLTIEVGKRDPSMADDFVLRTIGSEGAIFSLGW